MSNFFHHYKAYSDPTESPRSYHWWTAISAISALLGRKCFISQGIFTIYPQFYVVLVGDPALRKTTAMNIGKELVAAIGTVPVAPSTASKEALLDFMAKDGKVNYVLYGRQCSFHQTAAFASELATFMGGKHLNMEICKFLVDIWDSNKFSEMTRKGGTVTIPDPYFTMIACCTPDWIATQLGADVVSGGLARRINFIFEDSLYQLVPRPGLSEVQAEAWKQLLLEAKRINKLAGGYKLTDEAGAIFDAEYYKIMKGIKDYDEKTQHYFSARQTLTLKLCMCICAAYGNTFEITPQIIKLAHQALDAAEERMATVFRGIGRNLLKPVADKILDYIKASGTSIPEKIIFRQFYNNGVVDFMEFKAIMESLNLAGLVKGELAEAGINYRALDKQKAPESIDMLAEACKTNPGLAKPVTLDMVSQLLAKLKNQQITGDEYDNEN